MANFIGKKVSLVTENRTYEGYVHLLDVQTQQISLQKVVIADIGKKLNGLQTFFPEDIIDITVLPEECKKVESDDRLVKGKDAREKGPKMLYNKYTPEHLSRLRDFEPSSHLLRNVVTDGESTATEDTPKPVNRSSDYDSSSDQENLDCEDCFYISKLNQRFHDVVNHLKNQSEIGVSLTGVCVGRYGKLSLIQIATTKDVFIFDMVSLGYNCWDLGLKAILEDPRISKVMHDCRFPSDMLHHQFNVKLINIFDTQVADVFVYRLYHHSDWPKWVSGLSCSLFDHLEIPTDMVNNLKVRENMKKEDQEVWMTRPLPRNLLKIAVKEVVHLLQLRHVLSEKMMGEYIAGVDVYLSYVREASKEDAKKYQMNNHKLPVPFENLSGLLVNRDSHRYNRHRYNRGPPPDHDYNKDSSSGFRENCRGFVGTEVKYSNSSIWHQNFAKDSETKAVRKSPEKSVEQKLEIPRGETMEFTSEPKTTGRKSLLDMPLSQLNELKESLHSLERKSYDISSTNQDSQNSESVSVNQVSLNDEENSSSEKTMSLGQLIRSKIKYSDSDTDLELVPAGVMLTGKTLHKLKDKRLNQIELLSSQLEMEKSEQMKCGDKFSESPSVPKSSMTYSSPKNNDVSFNKSYATAPSTPSLQMYGPNVSCQSPNISSPFSPEVEHFKTAPTTPATNLATTSHNISGRINYSLSSETDSSGLESHLIPSQVASALNHRVHQSQMSPQISSDSDCPALFSFEDSKDKSFKFNLSPEKRSAPMEMSPEYSGLSSATNQHLNSPERAKNDSLNSSSSTSSSRLNNLMKSFKFGPPATDLVSGQPNYSPKSNESSHSASFMRSEVNRSQSKFNESSHSTSSECSEVNQPNQGANSITGHSQGVENQEPALPKPMNLHLLKSTTSKLERLKILKEAAKRKSPQS